MASDEIATASRGLSSQRSRHGLADQDVPADAISTATGPASRGDAPKVKGATVTAAGRGLLARRGGVAAGS